MGNPPRSPCAPAGAFRSALNGQECASPLSRVGGDIGGTLASPARYSTVTQNVTYPFQQPISLKPQPLATGRSGASPMLALCVEFVAKPQEAHRVESAIPAALAGSLKEVAGFAGSLVMVSDQEARLVTVVTLWSGEDRLKHRDRNGRWVQALLAPYLDRCLRVRSMVAHLPVLPVIRPEINDPGDCSVESRLACDGETVCVA
jgi:hypothetical protein